MRSLIPATALLLLFGCTEDDETGSESVPAAETAETDSNPAPEIALPEDELAALAALGYVDHAPAENPEERGVTTHELDDARGLNLYGSRDRAEALLVDLEGEVVHRWASERDEAWMHIEPLGEGELLAITKDVAIAKYDWDSQEIRRTRLPVHHDFAVLEDGRILALIRGRSSVTHDGATLEVLCDSIAVLSPDGEVLERHPLLPLLRNHFSSNRLDTLKRRADEGGLNADLLRAGGVGDMLHTNSIAVLEKDIEGVAPAGSILLSFRTLSRLAILSESMDEVLWMWGRGELDGQHDATQLANGHLMAFDNGLKRAEKSRVVEIDPVAEEVVWTFDPPDLYTRLRGGAQKLSNGHVLITESDAGHALEVTPEGEVVWEFWNPDVRGSQRATIYRLNRYRRSLFPQLSP